MKDQKFQHDKKSKNLARFPGGGIEFVSMPVLNNGLAYKLARQFEGPFCAINTYPNGVGLVPINKPKASTGFGKR